MGVERLGVFGLPALYFKIYKPNEAIMITIDGVEAPYKYVPYPKWIKVNGKDILVKTKKEHESYKAKKESKTKK